MRDGIRRLCAGMVASLALAANALAQQAAPTDNAANLEKPFTLSLQPAAEPESIYAPPLPRRPGPR